MQQMNIYKGKSELTSKKDGKLDHG
jgi:hypothetical protein